MAKIYQIPTPLIGSVNVFPTPKFALFGDNLATVTSPGYISSSPTAYDAYPIQPTDIIQAFYNYNPNTQSGDFGLFKVSIGPNSVITLIESGSGGGSGTVSTGLANQLAYYAANGTTVSGLEIENGAVLLTDASGVPAWVPLLQNQIVIGGATEPFAATLTAGSNITITANEGAGTVTIAAVGSGGSGTVNASTTNNITYYAADGDAVSGLATANSAVLVTDGTGVPSLSTTLPSGLALQTPASLTLTNATGLPIGGVSLGQSSSVFVSSSIGTSTALGPLTDGQLVIGSTSNSPVATTLTAGANVTITNGPGTITIAASGGGGGSGTVNTSTTNNLAYYAADGTAVSGLATANSSVLVTDGSGVPSLGTTLPSGLALQTPASVTLTNATGLPLTGISAGTNSAALVTSDTGVTTALALTDDQIVAGVTAGTPVAKTLTAGANITITSSPTALTIASSGGGGGSVTWNDVTGTSAAMDVSSGYISNNAALVTLTLPATSAVGDTIYILGFGAGGWTVAQNAGQSIYVGNVLTTVGTGGSVSSANRYDSMTLVCVQANTVWGTLNGPQSAGLNLV